MNKSPLDVLVLREIVAEVLAELRPDEIEIAALRLEGLTDTQIGEMLGVHRNTVRRRMQKAVERIVREVPGAAHLLSDRKRGVAADPRG